MDKRYQVFVSSTYSDLVEERASVVQVLMEMNCIPAGMELFPAMDEEQWQFIKKVIDDCDYYVVIIGGRYGTLTSEGLSYTEKEYDYAIEKGLKVLAFLHEKPDDIPVKKSDISPELRAKLGAFRGKISSGRLVKFWTTSENLASAIVLSLSQTIKAYPAIGWVRANQIANTTALSELNDLRKRNEDLVKSIADHQKAEPAISNLAGLNEVNKFTGNYTSRTGSKYSWEVTVTWGQIFGAIAPYLLEFPNDTIVKSIVEKFVKEEYARKNSANWSSFNFSDQDFQTIKIQLVALGLVTVKYSETVTKSWALFWYLTPHGSTQLMQLRAVKSTIASS